MSLPPKIARAFAENQRRDDRLNVAQRASSQKAATVPLPLLREPPPARATRTINMGPK